MFVDLPIRSNTTNQIKHANSYTNTQYEREEVHVTDIDVEESKVVVCLG